MLPMIPLSSKRTRNDSRNESYTFSRAALFKYNTRDHATFQRAFEMMNQNPRLTTNDIFIRAWFDNKLMAIILAEDLNGSSAEMDKSEAVWFLNPTRVANAQNDVEVRLLGPQPQDGVEGPLLKQWNFPASTPFLLIYEELCEQLSM